jgi:hypothetical protein
MAGKRSNRWKSFNVKAALPALEDGKALAKSVRSSHTGG